MDLLRSHFQQQFKPIICRFLTTTEASTALRPFYFSVHPDLFGQYPTQRMINENSLKQLSSFITSLQSRRNIHPCNLQFYLRGTSSSQSGFRLINIYLNEKDLRAAVLRILKSCDLSTEYVDRIPKIQPVHLIPRHQFYTKTKTEFHEDINFTNLENDPIFGAFVMTKKIKNAKDEFKLKQWLESNYKLALELSESYKPLREEATRLKKTMVERLGLLEIQWECGWNDQHLVGCLQSLKSMALDHPDPMRILKGRILVFAPFTGVSLDGHIMLNSAEVRHNWLDLIKNVLKYDAALYRIPAFEKALSQVLLDIKIGRRKFMPKILAGDYEKNLQQLTTNLSDYLSRRCYPSTWPKSLNEYEIVVETEAGPLMLSPTGQLITPSTCPGFLLVKFISEHLEEACQKMINYKRNKYVERSLHKQCIIELKLKKLIKNDNITPDLMIQCCNRLLRNQNILRSMNGMHLNIANYYSVLKDGTVCIPWNWNL